MKPYTTLSGGLASGLLTAAAPFAIGCARSVYPQAPALGDVEMIAVCDTNAP